ncbi:hypothetical protein HPO96_07390 [Kribbella sandramycini]|uniref:Uncharacterized protein n=1 Tax=Kribbella sandramycini TaxID=60450 RepID=A0A7Y4KWR3_9ACTN|nr:hypothetical protein [Kribbella sandramycini]MBB6567325.1 hypothetical protein [Kribbella sandramycini]NOL40063.1 hypothetical protein [Kribbella sandramycini]
MAHQNLPENEQDPGANTQMFRAFVSEGETAAQPKSNGRLFAILGAAAILVVVVVLIAVL